MENNFNFNSQVCTDKNQSERLLALGIKKETADCYLFEYEKEKYKVIAESWLDLIADEKYYSQYKDVCFPAWSLHRLIEMMPTHIHCGEETFIREIRPISISYIPTTYEHHFFLFKEISNTYYDGIIATIEWLIKEGYFNKEYLV